MMLAVRYASLGVIAALSRFDHRVQRYNDLLKYGVTLWVIACLPVTTLIPHDKLCNTPPNPSR